MTKEEATKIIAEKLSQAKVLIAQCEDIADKADVSFRWCLEYGMGGQYSDGEWNSSSANC